MRPIARWSFALLVPFLLSGHRPCVEFCSCVRLTTTQKIASADAIFVGEVIDVRETRRPARRGEPVTVRIARLRPTLMWKGEIPDTIPLPSGDGPDCLVSFRPGERYLILADLLEGEWDTSWCAGSTSTMTPQALDLLAELGPGREVTPRQNGRSE